MKELVRRCCEHTGPRWGCWEWHIWHTKHPVLLATTHQILLQHFSIYIIFHKYWHQVKQKHFQSIQALEVSRWTMKTVALRDRGAQVAHTWHVRASTQFAWMMLWASALRACDRRVTECEIANKVKEFTCDKPWNHCSAQFRYCPALMF